MTGKINSFQSLGAVDGPGLRYVIFMQGCNLRCGYCHNPETWCLTGGNEYSVEEIVNKVVRYKSYWEKDGGVTVSGGEALLQPEFCVSLFESLHKHGIHTCLDTSGICDLNKAVDVLKHTDLVICDLKFNNNDNYLKFTGGCFDNVIEFLKLTEKQDCKLWIRNVIIPTINDTESDVTDLIEIVSKFSNLEKVELLPFQKLCISKYENLNKKFKFENFDVCSKETIETLNLFIPKKYQ